MVGAYAVEFRFGGVVDPVKVTLTQCDHLEKSGCSISYHTGIYWVPKNVGRVGAPPSVDPQTYLFPRGFKWVVLGQIVSE